MFFINSEWPPKNRQVYTIVTLAVLVFLTLLLTSCKFGVPFSGPIAEKGTASDSETAVVALSYVMTGDDSAKNKVFWDYVMVVNNSLPIQKGYLGHSIRRVVLGKEGWTMTVWDNEKSLNEFVRGDLHQRAIDKSLNAVAKARFVRVTVKRSEVPIPWDKVEKILAEQGRDLY